jgi:hypothetical protein
VPGAGAGLCSSFTFTRGAGLGAGCVSVLHVYAVPALAPGTPLLIQWTAKFGNDRPIWLDPFDLSDRTDRWVCVTAAVGPGRRARLQPWVHFSPSAWTGSWTGSPDNPSVTSAVGAIAQVIAAASASGAPGRASCNRLVRDDQRSG